MSVPTLVRYFDLGGNADVDPIIDQPGSDAFGPLTTGFGGAVVITGWVVDAAGAKVAPGALRVTVAAAWVTVADVERVPPSSPNEQSLWGRGPLATDVIPGEVLTQVELPDSVGFQVVITAVNPAPLAGHRLAIFATRGPRS